MLTLRNLNDLEQTWFWMVTNHAIIHLIVVLTALQLALVDINYEYLANYLHAEHEFEDAQAGVLLTRLIGSMYMIE